MTVIRLIKLLLEYDINEEIFTKDTDNNNYASLDEVMICERRVPPKDNKAVMFLITPDDYK